MFSQPPPAIWRLGKEQPGMLNQRNFKQLSTTLAAKAEKIKAERADYNDDIRVPWLTLSGLYTVYSSCAAAAQILADLNDQIRDGLSGLAMQVGLDIHAIEEMVCGIDIQRVKSDARYAGGLQQIVYAARANADAVKKFALSIRPLVEEHTKLVAARDARTVFCEPSRPKGKFAVVPKNFVYDNGDRATRFYAGEHCRVVAETSDGSAFEIEAEYGTVWIEKIAIDCWYPLEFVEQ